MTSHIKEEQNASVHRAALLNGLLAPIPREIMHANKKVTQVDDTAGNERVVLHFQDGTVEYADAVIGADGIHGYTRKHILGDDPSVNASFAGYWDCRFLVPIERAREALGKELFTETRQYGWCGEGGFFMHDVLNNGESVQCVSSAMASTWGVDEWKRDLDRKTLEDSFAGWTNSPIAPGMIKVGYSLSMRLSTWLTLFHSCFWRTLIFAHIHSGTTMFMHQYLQRTVYV